MHSGTALLNEIIKNPADDTARLVYADWLENKDESGKYSDPARAEFIRVQIAKEVSLRRERELIKKHGQRWLKKAFGEHYADHLVMDPQGAIVNPFRHGFIDTMRCTPEQFFAKPSNKDEAKSWTVQADKWFAQNPLANLVVDNRNSFLHPNDTPDTLTRLLDSPHIQKLDELLFAESPFVQDRQDRLTERLEAHPVTRNAVLDDRRSPTNYGYAVYATSISKHHPGIPFENDYIETPPTRDLGMLSYDLDMRERFNPHVWIKGYAANPAARL